MDGTARTLDRPSAADGDLHGDAEAAALKPVWDPGDVRYREPRVNNLSARRGNVADFPHTPLDAVGFLRCDKALAPFAKVPVAVAVHIKIAVAVEHAPDTGFRLGAEDEQEVPGRVGVLRLLGEGAVDLRQPAPPTLA